MATELGPVISKAQYDRVLAFAADADVLTGGTRAEGFEERDVRFEAGGEVVRCGDDVVTKPIHRIGMVS